MKEKIYSIYSELSPLNRWAIKFFITIVVIAIIGILAVSIIANGEEKQEKPKQEVLISCDNPAGCVGKFPKGTGWPVCPICNTPISSVVDVSKDGNIAEEIVFLFEETRSLHDEIQRIKEKRRLEEEERIKNLKAYDIAYAEKVRDNMKVLADAYARTKTFLEKGGEEIPGSVIAGFIGAKPVWKKIEDFPIYPRPK